MRLPTLPTLVRTALIAAPLFLLAAGPASAQLESREGIALRNDIYQLQQEVQRLQQQIAQQGGGAPTYLGGGAAQSGGNDLVPQLLQRVDDLSEQVRQLRGQVQEAQNQLQQQTAILSKRIDDLAFQMQNPGAAAGQGAATTATGGTASTNAGPAAISPPPAPLGATHAPASTPPTQPSPPRTAEAAIREGNTALARHDYRAAEVAAREVLSKFRTSPRAYDAQYLLGEALQGQRQYPQAAIAYDDAYNRSRKGSHAQQALVGLAASLTAINERKAACDTLTKLHAEFPHEPAEIRETAATLHKRAGCK